MRTKDFYFNLPENYIAQKPSKTRGDDKLLVLDKLTGAISDLKFSDFLSLIPRNAVLVFNDSKVRKARVYAKKVSSGNQCEFLLISPVELPKALANPCSEKSPEVLRNPAPTVQDYNKTYSEKLPEVLRNPAPTVQANNKTDCEKLPEVLKNPALTVQDYNKTDCEKLPEKSQSFSVWKVLVKNSKRHKPGMIYSFEDGSNATIIEDTKGILEKGGFRILKFDSIIDDCWLEKYGAIPLPPYITRLANKEDETRYQTVFANDIGSLAAPTAGLHFTKNDFVTIEKLGIEQHRISLNVGLGTFLPVRTEKIKDHKMHTESYFICDKTASDITMAKKEGRPIIAIGTTSIRCLEAAWDKKSNSLRAGEGKTNIFIYPGYKFNVVDQIFTNFHTPESTLLMLVSAFAGNENILNAYDFAIKNNYRFFSYGDAMYIR